MKTLDIQYRQAQRVNLDLGMSDIATVLELGSLVPTQLRPRTKKDSSEFNSPLILIRSGESSQSDGRGDATRGTLPIVAFLKYRKQKIDSRYRNFCNMVIPSLQKRQLTLRRRLTSSSLNGSRVLVGHGLE
jgi:hypothetical protein